MCDVSFYFYVYFKRLVVPALAFVTPNAALIAMLLLGSHLPGLSMLTAPPWSGLAKVTWS